EARILRQHLAGRSEDRALDLLALGRGPDDKLGTRHGPVAGDGANPRQRGLRFGTPDLALADKLAGRAVDPGLRLLGDTQLDIGKQDVDPVLRDRLRYAGAHLARPDDPDFSHRTPPSQLQQKGLLAVR